MQIWPPKELPISAMSAETPIRGMTMGEFEVILKRGFADMYAHSSMPDVAPVALYDVRNSKLMPSTAFFFRRRDGILTIADHLRA